MNIVALALGLALLGGCASVPDVTAPERLTRLAANAWERGLDLFPVSETMGRGAGPRQDRLELTFTNAHRERQRAYHQWILGELKGIPLSGLDETGRLTHRLLSYRAEQALEWLNTPLHQHYIFIQIDGGVATNLIKLVERQPLRNESDYRAWFRRLARYPEYLDGVAVLMREGAKDGLTIPSVLVERALAQFESLAPDPERIGDSALWKPMVAFPETIDPVARAALEAEYRGLLTDQVFPALRRVALFVRSEYLPQARTTDGLGELSRSLPAQWHPPSDDGTRPGMFMMPVVDAATTGTYGLAALTAHEGMPGHHFDGGIKLELEVPDFRRRMWVNAFGEGWGLYAESLGHELGLYDAPLERMGRYSAELFRACRLVVDTGLHAKNWTRQRAITYLVEECGTAPDAATVEVLRNMAWPGQALGYKIGELTILELRRKAEQRLGERFDIRAFHDAFLAEGHMPLQMARERMAAWIEAQAKKH